MEEVSKKEFDKAVRLYARFALPDSPTGNNWTYFGVNEERIGVFDGRKCWLEERILGEMSTGDGQDG